MGIPQDNFLLRERASALNLTIKGLLNRSVGKAVSWVCDHKTYRGLILDSYPDHPESVTILVRSDVSGNEHPIKISSIFYIEGLSDEE